ncbi:MAG: hypothetical protein IPP71_00275 [Bacteroidetes bacterium]|nr:hypothetical protein [Bacteroidota bacterium]
MQDHPVKFYSQPIFLTLLVLFITYTILGFWGYGNDYDTYAMIKSGRDTFLNGHYHYSRGPGNFIPEMVIGGASLLGGFIVTNIISALLGTATLYLLWKRIKTVLSPTNSILVILIIGLNPWYVIASSSSMDYVYSLFFAMAGIGMMEKRNIFPAACLFAFAVSSRLTVLMIIGIIYLYYFYIRFKENEIKEMGRLFLSGCLLMVLSVLFFVPSYVAADYTFKFMEYGIGNWDLIGILSRIIYKHIYLIGLLPLLFLAVMTIIHVFKSGIKFKSNALLNTGIIIIVLTELLFIKIPVEISYLLPQYLIAVPLIVFLVKPRKMTLYLLLAFTISFGFIVNPDVLDRKYNAERTEAISAEVGFFIRPGLVIDDIMKREESKDFYWQK